MHLGARGFVHAELVDPDGGQPRRARGRRHRRARADAPPSPRRAAAAVQDARSRRGGDEPVRVRADGPARALHRPHRRHADRARASTSSLPPCARSSRRSRPRSAATSSSDRTGDGREAGAAAARRASSSRAEPADDADLAEAIREKLRSVLVVQTKVELVPWGTLSAASTSRRWSNASRGRDAGAEAAEPGRPPHHARRRRPPDVDRLLGGRARHAVHLRAAEPRQRRRRAISTSIPGDGRLITVFTSEDRVARPDADGNRPRAASITSPSRCRRPSSTRRSSGSTSAGSSTAVSRIAGSWTRSTSRIRSVC